MSAPGLSTEIALQLGWLFLMPLAGALLAYVVPLILGQIIDFVREMLGV